MHEPDNAIHKGWLGFLVVIWPVIAAAAPNGSLVESEFAARSGPRGATLFVELPPEQTGIETENPYDDPRMWGERYRELTFGAIGTGIAISDYDGDDRADVFVVSKTGKNRLFRNLGNLRFEDVTESAGLGPPASGWRAKIKGWLGMGDGNTDPNPWKQGATFADVNNDGHPDLYVCRFALPNLLYVNQGDGTFVEDAAARGLAVTDASGMAAFHDYDRDGWLDVYLQTNMLNYATSPKGQRDYLFRNNGDGTFVDVTSAAGISGETAGHSATWWDYNNDGWPDLYVANDFATSDSLYRNNRNGTFTDVINEVVPRSPYYSMGADLGDVNNDGLIDFLVADMAATSPEKDQRSMAGSRARGQVNPENPDEAPQYMRNALYLNTDTGFVLEGAHLAGLSATDWTWSVRMEDLDNDGLIDVHVTNGMNREYHGTDLLEKIMVTEDRSAPVRIMRESPVLNETNLAFKNLGDLRFENTGRAWGLDQHGVSFGAAFGDLDGDGDLDLVFANYDAGVSVMRNDAQLGNRLIVALRGTSSNRFGVGASVAIETASGSQVRNLVLARGSLSNSEPVLHFGLGDDSEIRRLTIKWPSGHTQEFTNLSANRKLTITEPDSIPPAPQSPVQRETLFVEAGREAGMSHASREDVLDETSRQPFLPIRQNRRGPALAAGDLNGDGRDDVVLGGTTRDATRILFSTESGTFTAVELPGASAARSVNDGPVLIVDANGDGAGDILVAKGGVAQSAGSPAYQPQLFLNDGTGTFRIAGGDALPNLHVSAGALVAFDFDRDGDSDVFLGGRVVPGAYPSLPRSALLVNEGGKFRNATSDISVELERPGLVTSALARDVDGDGWDDLVLTVEWGPVMYFRNNEGRGFEDRTDSAGFASGGSGWWRSIASADFNGDGRPDFAVGNLGLNTQYQADTEHPAVLFYGRMSRTGSPQIIDARHDGDRLIPWRTRAELGAQIPSIRRQFPDNSEFARASIEEILDPQRLAEAERFEATEFRSGVFLSRPDGTFVFQPFPRIAQIAPMEGIVAGDFDGDGLADIYAVQNQYAPVQLIGRFVGGLSQMLRGDGAGNFTALQPAETGLIVQGDAKAVVSIDFNNDGKPDFFVSRNDDTTLAFLNNGSE